MADSILNQSEIESLMQALSSGEAPPAPAAAPSPPRPAAAGGGGGGGAPAAVRAAPAETAAPAGLPTPLATGPRRGRERITTYDFKRPERVGKEQMRALQTMHEGFGRNIAAGLSGMLRTMVEVKLISVDQLTYSELIFSLDNPTCFNLLKAEPLAGNLIVDLDPTILFPIIDRLLGGREAGGQIKRTLTEIELRLVSRITDLLLRELKIAWKNILELDLEVIRVESNPQLVQIVPPNEVVVLISFEVLMHEIRGMINLCIPFNALEKISSKLTSNSWITYGQREVAPENVYQTTRNMRHASVEVCVELARTQITTGDLLELRVGDIITTEKDKRTLLQVNVEGTPKFLGFPRSVKGRKAILIEDKVPDDDPPLGKKGA